MRSSIKIGLAIRSVAETFNKEAELKELLKFYSDNKNNFGATVKSIQIAIQTVKANVRWIRDHLDEVSAWYKGAVGQDDHGARKNTTSGH